MFNPFTQSSLHSLDYRVISTEISETLFDTIYHAYFVPSFEDAKAILDSRASSALQALQSHISLGSK